MRTLEQHREVSNEHRHLQSKAQQTMLEKKFGIRYSILLELPYFNPICMAVIDSMHNLFLGTAKYIMQFWIDNDIITKVNIKCIEDIV